MPAVWKFEAENINYKMKNKNHYSKGIKLRNIYENVVAEHIFEYYFKKCIQVKLLNLSNVLRLQLKTFLKKSCHLLFNKNNLISLKN